MSQQLTHLIKDGRSGLWWGPNSQGYRRDITEAGIYTEAEAKRIASNPDPGRNEIAVPLADYEDEARLICNRALAFRDAVLAAKAVTLGKAQD